MPSDLPSQTPPGAAAPIGGNIAPTRSGATRTGRPTAGTSSAATYVRRYSAQNRSFGGRAEEPAGISNSFTLAMLAPLPHGGTTVSSAVINAPPVAAVSQFVRAHGAGMVNQSARQAQRVGNAEALAALCGLRSRAWVNNVREALGKQLASEYPTFDPKVNAILQMQQHIMANYAAGQETAQQVLNERGKKTLCADLPYLPDYRTAVRVSEQANIRSR